MTRVLIVDDTEENLYLLRVLLEGHGFEVDEACHGADALAKARRTPPQLIISDLLMPVMDGYMLLHAWRTDERLKQVPFVVYSATFAEPNDQRLALDLGADAFILKPIEPEAFIARILEILAKAEHHELPPARAPQVEEKGLLKAYSVLLIDKLEQKTFQLEQANRALQVDNDRRQQAEADVKRLLAEAVQARGALSKLLQDQRGVEARLRESERHYRHLFDNMREGVAYCRMLFEDGQPRDVVYLEVNRAFEALTGLKNVVGKKMTEVIPGIRESNPELIEVYGRVATTNRPEVFETYVDPMKRWFSASTICPEPGHIVVVFDNISERKRVEQNLRNSTARLEAVSRKLLEVQENERRSVARELHDEVGAVLTAVKLNLQALLRSRTGEQSKEALVDSMALVDGAIETVSSLSLDLRPAVLDDLGLIPALEWYCERQSRRAGVPIELELDAIDLKSAPQLEVTCFRIVQESVTNALRHANARRISLVLRRCDGAFSLEIADDGGGFDVAAARNRGLVGGSSGLSGMEERATLTGGRLSIDSAPGAGARVRAEFALPEG